MELHLVYAILTINLLIVFWQDIKQRAIHFSLPILVFLIAWIINFLSNHLDYIMALKNIGFVTINIIGLTLYFSFKQKTILNPIDSKIGLGDVLIFIAITPLFNLKSYILFFILSMVFSLVLHVIVNRFKKQKTVPLAGYMSLFLIGFIFLERVLNLNLIML